MGESYMDSDSLMAFYNIMQTVKIRISATFLTSLCFPWTKLSISILSIIGDILKISYRYRIELENGISTQL